jgi:hypothetical protein
VATGGKTKLQEETEATERDALRSVASVSLLKFEPGLSSWQIPVCTESRTSGESGLGKTSQQRCTRCTGFGGIHRDERDKQDKIGWALGATLSDAADAVSIRPNGGLDLKLRISCSNSNPDFLRGKSMSAPSRVHRVNRGWEKHLNKDAHDAQDSGGFTGMNRIKPDGRSGQL